MIASEARDKLFSGMPAVGESIRIDGVTFEVIGVGAPRMQEGDNDNNRVVYIPYNSMDVLKDNHYLDGIWLDSAGLDHDKMDKPSARLWRQPIISSPTTIAPSLSSTPRSSFRSSASSPWP